MQMVVWPYSHGVANVWPYAHGDANVWPYAHGVANVWSYAHGVTNVWPLVLRRPLAAGCRVLPRSVLSPGPGPRFYW